MRSLRYFLNRSSTLRLYRDILRAARTAPDDVGKAIKQEARRQFESDIRSNPNPDSHQIDFLISKGREKLGELRKMLALVR